MIKLVIPKEQNVHEKRVAATPETVRKFLDSGCTVYVETGAGSGAFMSDALYEKAGAKIIESASSDLFTEAPIVLRVTVSRDLEIFKKEVEKLSPKTILVGMLGFSLTRNHLQILQERKITAVSLDLIPRITRAQTMDVPSSQNNLLGYRAAIEGAYEHNRAFPLMMTAAGTVAPARVLILGAGVAGLQAIATAKRLGAIVSAFDVRAAVKEQVQSLGAVFIEVPSEEVGDTQSGYAQEMSLVYQKKQAEKISEAVQKSDLVITTALIPGKKAPVLITQEMVDAMRPGSIIIDLAAASGGNCALTVKDQLIQTEKQVKIMGFTHLLSRIAGDATHLYARNVLNFLGLLIKEGSLHWDWEDDIIKNTVIIYEGEVIHPQFQ